jgi:hypothetical protein
MPLEWKRSQNPYRCHDFARLQLGPNARPTQVLAQARNLVQRLAAGDVLAVGDEPLDERAIHEASKRLRDPVMLAHELLLVHAPPRAARPTAGALPAVVAELAKVPPPRDRAATPDLNHPLGLLWFVPTPDEAVVGCPTWSELGLVEPGDQDDLRLDIVFDA